MDLKENKVEKKKKEADQKILEETHESNDRKDAGTSFNYDGKNNNEKQNKGRGEGTLKMSHTSPPWASLFRNNMKEGAGIKLSKTETSQSGPVFVEEDFVEENE